MFVIVAGGGRTGTQLASLLLAQDHNVHLVEHRPEILARIHYEIPTEAVYEGSPTEPQILEQAGIRKADVVAATTDNDADNLSICFIARERYNVGRTIARINNPRTAWLFDDRFHVDVSFNNAEVMASLIMEQMSMGDMMTLLKLRRGRYSLVEEKIASDAKVLGQAIKDVRFPEQCVIAAIIRQGEIVVPRGATVFEAGDEVLAVTDHAGAVQLAELFEPHP
ncbi:MAG: NAD-binding protein [Anaerolineae bacterium]